MRHAASTSGFLWDVYSKSDTHRSPYRVWGPDDRSKGLHELHLCRYTLKLQP